LVFRLLQRFQAAFAAAVVGEGYGGGVCTEVVVLRTCGAAGLQFLAETSAAVAAAAGCAIVCDWQCVQQHGALGGAESGLCC
jgi:hypothetical protein